MKRFISILLATSMVLAAFTGCGKSGSGSSGSSDNIEVNTEIKVKK